MGQSTQNPLDTGQEALGRGAWEEARAAFEDALSSHGKAARAAASAFAVRQGLT